MAHASADGASAFLRLLPRSRIQVSSTGYRRLERLAELAGTPLPPGLLGRWAAFANDIEAGGEYECEDDFYRGASELIAVHAIDRETGARVPVVRLRETAYQARQTNTVPALLGAPEPHRSAFEAALRRLSEPPAPRERHDWRAFPAAADVYGLPVACAACGLLAVAPDAAANVECRPGVRSPVHPIGRNWYMSNFGEMAHVIADALGMALPRPPSVRALCGAKANGIEGSVQFNGHGSLYTPWQQYAQMRAERADCPACIAALGELPRALTGTHDWRIAGDGAGCPACGMTCASAEDAAFGCDGGVFLDWIRSVRQNSGSRPPETRMAHGEGWDCAALRRNPDLRLAETGQRITCMSCLREGRRAPALSI